MPQLIRLKPQTYAAADVDTFKAETEWKVRGLQKSVDRLLRKFEEEMGKISYELDIVPAEGNLEPFLTYIARSVEQSLYLYAAGRGGPKVKLRPMSVLAIITQSLRRMR